MDEKNLKESNKDKVIIFIARTLFIGTLTIVLLLPFYLLVGLFNEIIGNGNHLVYFDRLKIYIISFILVFFVLYFKIVGFNSNNSEK
jgi:hypothetical protein